MNPSKTTWSSTPCRSTAISRRNSFGAHIRDGKAIRAYADEVIKELDIRCFSAQQHTGTLSGGNQQKVCIARALAMNPRLLFVSEPTRGIDIGAKKLVLETLVRLNRERA